MPTTGDSTCPYSPPQGAVTSVRSSKCAAVSWAAAGRAAASAQQQVRDSELDWAAKKKLAAKEKTAGQAVASAQQQVGKPPLLLHLLLYFRPQRSALGRLHGHSCERSSCVCTAGGGALWSACVEQRVPLPRGAPGALFPSCLG